MPKLASTLDLLSEKEVDAVIYGCTERPKAEKSAKALFLFTKKNCLLSLLLIVHPVSPHHFSGELLGKDGCK